MMNDSLLHMYSSNSIPAADSQDLHSHSHSHSNEEESPFQDDTDSAGVVVSSSGTLASELQRATNPGTNTGEKNEETGLFFMDMSGDVDDKKPRPACVSMANEMNSSHSIGEERSEDSNSPVQSTSEHLSNSAALNGTAAGPQPLPSAGGGVLDPALAAGKPPAKSPKRVTFAPVVTEFAEGSSKSASGEETKSRVVRYVYMNET